MAETNLDLVRHALTVAREQGFAEVEITEGDLRFSAVLEPKKRVARPAALTPAEDVPDAGPALVEIKAGLVGYYRRAGVGLEVGGMVESGQIVAAIAALGLISEIESPSAGEVVEVLVEPDAPVQYGQVLARIRP